MKKYLPALVLCFIFLKSNAQIFHENFEAPSFGDSVISSSTNASNSGWNLCSRLHANGSYCDSAYLGLGDTVTLTTAPFSTVGYPGVVLFFNHICKTSFFDKAILEYSYDGITWTQMHDDANFQNVTYFGSAPFYFQLSDFSAASYGNWAPGNPSLIPDNTWWQQEAFDLTGVLSNIPTAQIRFKMYDEFADLTDTINGWKIDDITIDSVYFGSANFSVSSTIDTCIAPQNISFNVNGAAIGYSPADSVNAHIYFGDGTDSIFNIPTISGSFNATVTHVFNFSGAYSSEVILTSPDGIVDTITHYNIFLIGNNCDNISGQVYIDYNSDCLFNSNDEALKYRQVKLLYNGQTVKTTFTDISGNYSFYVPSNPYTIEIDGSILINTNLSVLCPPSGFFSVTSVPSSGNDFALNCNPGFDLYTNLYINRFRPNIQDDFYAFYGGNSCQLMSGIAKLVLDPMVSFISSNPAPQSINNDTLVWNFNNIHFTSPFNPRVTIQPSPVLNLGDSICFVSYIEPIAGDADTSNNIYYGCAVISNSCDPNQKLVNPDGNISSSTELNYTIEFQNIGNDAAYNIYVLDTLDSDLDVNTLRINGASHNMTIDFFPGNVLKFNFINIMLPDSGADEPASHGFISYSIKPISNLSNGTTITNTAAIYFDFNLPVITNTTLNVIDSTLTTAVLSNEGLQSEDIKVYPNPVSDELKIYFSEKFKSETSIKIIIYNLLGEKIFEEQNLSSSATINLKKIECGVYFYEITGNREVIKKGKLIKM